MNYRVMVASVASRKALAIAYSLKRVLKAFVVGVSHRSRHPLSYSRFFDVCYTVVSDRSDLKWSKALAELAEDLRVELIIPVDFVDIIACSKSASAFKKRGITLAAPNYERARRAASKEVLADLVKGVAEVPKTVVFKGLKDARSVESLSPPLVVKGLGDASRPSYYPSVNSALEEAVKRAPCIVQEYIVGKGRGYYAVCVNGEPLLEFTHERIVEYDPAGGASLAAKGPILDPNLYALGRSIVKRLEWSGPIMVETKWQPEAGKYYVLELNPKFWGSLDLPVRLGFHFPAVLALAFLEGPEKARELARRFLIHRGEFYWILDSIRYLAKLPTTWLFIAKRAFFNPQHNDLFPLDPVKTLAQVVTASVKLSRERVVWFKLAENDLKKLKKWAELLRSKALHSKSKPLIIFDLDGTLADVVVDWKVVRRKLVHAGIAHPWESIASALSRLWSEDKSSYYAASKLIEGYEVSASVRPIARDLYKLKRLYGKVSLCLATRQSVRAAEKALRELKLRELFKYVAGRDSGAGPLKGEILKECLQALNYSDEDLVLTVNDNLTEVVEAYRSGFFPLRVVSNDYQLVKTVRLGIPAVRRGELVPAITSITTTLLRGC